MIKHLALSWSVSRGRETEGYNICRLDDNETGKRYKTIGGGYDMIGTVIGQLIADQYQDRLQSFVNANKDKLQPYGVTSWQQLPEHYGLFVKSNGSVSLDGACGLDCMIKIAKNIGVDITSDYNQRKRRTVGFFVEF